MPEPKAPQDVVMPLPLAKRMLSMAEAEPLGCAFGMTKDKKECMLLIQKTGSGKKAAATLRTDGKELALDPTTVRFGTVHFQMPDDPGTVRFTVNKSEAGGTVMTLTRLAKKAGYQAILIDVDPDLEKEPEEQEAVGTVPAAPQTAPEPTAPPVDVRALMAELGGLARRIPEAAGSDAEAKARLLKLAAEANAQIKANALDAAVRGVAALRDAIDNAGSTPKPAQAGPTEGGLQAASLTADLSALIRRVPEALAAGVDPAAKGVLAKCAAEAGASLKAGELQQAADRMIRLREAVHDAYDAAGIAPPGVPPPKDPPTAQDGLLPAFHKAAAGLTAGLAAIDKQMAILKVALIRTGDDELMEVAEDHLDRVVGDAPRKLAAMLDQLGGGEAGLRAAAPGVSAELAKVLAWAESSGAVTVCEDNPVAVPVAIRATLRQVIAPLQAVMTRAAG